jgi:hypothetical protein
MIDNELRVPVEPHKDELASDLCGILNERNVLIFFETERPQFIDGQLARTNVAQLGIEQSGASFTGQRKETQNGFLMDSDDARGCADADAFDQVVNDLDCGLFLDAHLSKRLFQGFGECAVAFLAAVTLNSLASVLSRLFHFNRAIVTGHFGFLLDLACGETQNQMSESPVRVSSAWGD